MIYIALLRGINVGVKARIKMSDLKIAFEENGCENVRTYINSGNVIFETKEKEDTLRKKLEKDLSKRFNYDSTLTIRSFKKLQEIVDNAPKEWKKKNDLRCYIAFIFNEVDVKDIAKEIKINPEVDSYELGKDVIYMTTKLSGITKSGFKYLVGKKIFQFLTIRNFTTTSKLLDLIKEKN